MEIQQRERTARKFIENWAHNNSILKHKQSPYMLHKKQNVGTTSKDKQKLGLLRSQRPKCFIVAQNKSRTIKKPWKIQRTIQGTKFRVWLQNASGSFKVLRSADHVSSIIFPRPILTWSSSSCCMSPCANSYDRSTASAMSLIIRLEILMHKLRNFPHISRVTFVTGLPDHASSSREVLLLLKQCYSKHCEQPIASFP